MHALRGAAVASLLSFARVSAAEQDRPFGLSYEAPRECPGAIDLSMRIRAGTAHARPATGEEPRYDVSLVVARSENGFLASLQIRAPDGTETARAVPAPTCAEVVDAVALIVAITIDPEAAALGSARQDENANSGAAAPPAQEPVPAAPKDEHQGPKKPRARAPLPVSSTQPDRAFPKHYFVDAGVGVVFFAIAPDPTPDFHLGGAFEIDSAELFAPRLELSLHGAVSFSVTTPEGRAKFERWAGRLTACPLRWGTRSSGLRPCALFEAGYYAAGGYDSPGGELFPFLWGAPGLAVSGDLAGSRRLRARADLGVLFPLLAGNAFYFDPSKSNVHEIPPVGVFLDVAFEFQIL